MTLLSSVTFILGVGAALATAVAAPEPTNPPVFKEATLAKRDSCTFTDADTASQSKTSCSTIVLSNIAVPSGTTLDITDLEDGTTVIFDGETTFGYAEWDGPLVSVSGTDIYITGTEDHVLNGDGARWWDGLGGNGGVTKPKFFAAHKLLGSSVIDGLYILNSPKNVFSISGADGLVLKDIIIDDSDGDVDSLGHNTDAFNVGESTNITISGANVQNQDDCLAINSGSGITFTGGTCSGSHGLSIGSVGGRDDNDVSDVLIESSTVKNSANGIRIKTVYNATGSVSDIIFRDITLDAITDYGIIIEQDYENGSPTGEPTNGVPITNLTVSDISGTVTDDAVEIFILCGEGSCSDWVWENINITGGEQSDDCENVPDGASC